MLCPESWLYWVRVNRDQLRTLLEPLLDLPIERVLVSRLKREPFDRLLTSGLLAPSIHHGSAAVRSEEALRARDCSSDDVP